MNDTATRELLPPSPASSPARSRLDASPGQREAELARWMKRYQNLVRAVVRRVVIDPFDVEDVMQETFLKVWRAMDQYDPARGKEGTFVATIARRCAIDQNRRRRNVPRPEDVTVHEPQEAPQAEPRLELNEEIDRVGDALRKLGSVRARIIALTYLDGWSHREVARSTGLSLGTVKSHVRRGMRELQARLAPLLAGRDPGRSGHLGAA